MLILQCCGVILAILVAHLTNAKVYNKCELAQELRYQHNIDIKKIGVYVCIAERQSDLNTAAVGAGQYYGMYQLSSEFWCGTSEAGKACNIQCSDLLDDNITDDLECLSVVMEEHERLSGDGFNAWPSNQFCKQKALSYVEECFTENNQVLGTYEKVTEKQNINKNVGTSKIYERCELAKELRYIHNIPMEQVSTWICIAKHESNFNTSAVGRLNWDGSGDHGLFQISDIYWCSTSGKGKACDLSCDELVNNDITDDVRCMRQIYEEHTRLSGDGFTAWAVYNGRCKGRADNYIADCFDESENEILPYKPKPGVFQPKTTQVYKNYQTLTRKKSSKKRGTGKIYEKCELAKELVYDFGISMDDVATWVCIAKHESNFNTSAIGRLNYDGSEDHGLFQISDIYWCSTNGRGKACDVSCSEFEDNDISDDVSCMTQIHEEHTRISGDGFTAWTVYQGKCKGKSEEFIEGCFDDNKNEIRPRPGIVAPVNPPKPYSKSSETGKVYQPCELAQELRYKHNIPMEQVATWVCIAKHESNFNTSAIGRLNYDGSEDHGLFQISDIYWCSINGRGKACDVSCSEFEDNDITDDIECMMKIYEEHTRLFGDGFTAWTVYQGRCKGQDKQFIDGCFDDNQNDNEIPTIQTTFKTKINTSKMTPTLKQTTTTKKIPTTTKESITRKLEITKPTTKSSITTVKPAFNLFDFYFNSNNKPKTNNEVISQTKSPIFNSNSQTQVVTSSTAKNSIFFNVGISNDRVNEQKTLTPNTTFKQYRTTLDTLFYRSTTTKTPVTTTKTTKAPVSSKTQSQSIKNTQSVTQKTTQRSSLITTTKKQFNEINSKIENSIINNSVKPTPFNVFAFYLNDFNKKPTPIQYKPIIFDKQPLKKANLKQEITTRYQSSTLKLTTKAIEKTTTKPQKLITKSFYNNYPDIVTTKVPKTTKTFFNIPKVNPTKASFNSFVQSNNQIAGKGKPLSITARSFEYLLTLTPRTNVYG